MAVRERRFDDVDLLVIYIDGLRFAGHHVVAATAFLHAERSFRRIIGCEDLWMLRAALGDKVIDKGKKAA